MGSMSQGRAEASPADRQPGNIARSLVEQARVKDFRDRFLQRYPRSLRNAAQVALGLYEPESGNAGDNAVLELEEADARQWAEKARHDRARTEERDRVYAVMDSCTTDVALWNVMEQEVFSLPGKLGVAQEVERGSGKKKKGKPKAKSTEATKRPLSDVEGAGDVRAMDIHGPLYSPYISRGLALLENAFARPSPYMFKLLPRVKELGLPSYVLGVSTPFYSRLARIHWTRYGDANSALEVLHEMISAGLYANRDVKDLLASIRNHLHGCNWGSQGEFVMAMMESPPYDAVLSQKLEEMERFAAKSITEREQEYGV
ncbi:hypothetical protein K4F52_008690 [Lecanicillium sp. MT-2017a]|nr:hypothetical protein K4F52_008690 [Lecanicillium sp. MT-2017a]